MKIDIRDESRIEDVDKIAFAGISDQCVNLNGPFIYIESCDDHSTTATVRRDDIPNLIKALQRVCEIKGIKL